MWLLVGCLLVSWCSGHAYLVSPAPRDAGDRRLKEYPCGEGLGNRYDLPGTVLQPGPLTVVFRETINHAGAPYRLALTTGGKDDRFDDFVLLDHVPHCDGCGSVPRDHAVTVTIPDLACDACAIQVIQVMTDKFSSPCANPAGLASSCGRVDFAYFSCSNVRINGTQASVPPFYRSVLSGASRAPYSPGETNSGAWQRGADNVWHFMGQSNVTTSTTTTTTTAPGLLPGLLPGWEKWFLPVLLVGIVVAIAAILIVFVVCRRRRARRMARPVQIRDLDDPAAFDADF
jgi:hypothetical protein